MFYVSQKPNIKRNPNGIKTDGELFWNIWDFPEEDSTRNSVRGGQEIGGAPSPWARLALSWDTRKAVDALLLPQKANFTRKIWAKDSPQSELRISRYKRNGEGVELENAETER